MLRTVLSRNQLLKETLKKSLRINSARSLSVECTKRRHRNINQVSLLKSTQKVQWKYETARFYADLPAHHKVALPALSPTMDTGTIVTWEKKEGDKLNEGDLLAEIETDKATMGFETPEEGYLAKILVPSGTKNVPIGKLVCIIVSNQADVAAFKNYTDDGAAAPSPKAAAPPAASAAAPSLPPAPPAAAAPAGGGESGKRVYASPMAKRLADQRKIRLEGIKGTGLYGSITSKDLEAAGVGASAPLAAVAAKGAAPAARAPPKPGASYTDTPISSMRSTIAKRLTESKQTIPHYYLSIEIYADELIALRLKFNEMLAKQKIKLSLNDFIIKAAAVAQRKIPEANSIWMGSVIRQFHTVDISVAVATDKGLITPIIFDADRKGIIEISNEVKSLAAKARANKLQPHEYQGGTITISNVGMFGVNQIAPIINPPQALILGVGATKKKLIIDDSEKGFKQIETLNLTASCDHRILDGAVGSKWLAIFRDIIEDPTQMLL